MDIRNLTSKHHRSKLSGLILLLVADTVVLGGSDAKKVAAWMLIAGFGLVVATAYWLIYAALAFLRLYGLVIRRKRRLAVALSGLLAVMLALQSVGGLNPKDVLLLLPLIVIGYNYVSYNLNRPPAS
jgi:hypothetical protein